LLDLFALITIMFWPVIPLFWIPVHFATTFFKKLGLLTYLMPMITCMPLAYLIYQHKFLILNFKVQLPILLNIAGVVLFSLGLIIHVWTARLLGLWALIGLPEISIIIKKELVTGGPFSVVRHPTYLAHTLMFCGVFLITEVIAVGIIAIVDFTIINSIIIRMEEKELLSRFGEDYASYKKKVASRFFPGII
jgi:protein-S-isoprenylcysteine O-methyltransferase Ste14